MTLTEFLLARIAEDEANAEQVPRTVEWRRAGDREFMRIEWPADLPTNTMLETRVATTMPSPRVLAECEAKRTVVLDCEEVLTKDVEYNEKYGRASFARGVLIHLAEPYADHPGYSEGWRP